MQPLCHHMPLPHIPLQWHTSKHSSLLQKLVPTSNLYWYILCRCSCNYQYTVIFLTSMYIVHQYTTLHDYSWCRMCPLQVFMFCMPHVKNTRLSTDLSHSCMLHRCRNCSAAVWPGFPVPAAPSPWCHPAKGHMVLLQSSAVPPCSLKRISLLSVLGSQMPASKKIKIQW